MDSVFTSQFVTGILSGSFSMAIPLLLATLGEIFVERSGMLNMGIEGMILLGCFVSFIGALFSASAAIGILLSVAVGVLIGLFMGMLTLKMNTNQSIAGVVFNFFAIGATGFFNRYIIGVSLIPTKAVMLQSLRIPFLADIPIIGFLFNQNILAYTAILLVPITSFILFRTNIGLKIRAVGGNAQAADTMGIDVNKIRYWMWIVGAVLAFLAGAYLTLSIGMFSDGMSSNRGYIAIALVVFARWKPSNALLGSFIFGFADAIQLRLQALSFDIPYQFLVMLPYILTILALVIAAKSRYVNPSVIGVPYIRESKELS
ncbi:MAG: ABC transporter permease [Clostridia bacterium]